MELVETLFFYLGEALLLLSLAQVLLMAFLDPVMMKTLHLIKMLYFLDQV